MFEYSVMVLMLLGALGLHFWWRRRHRALLGQLQNPGIPPTPVPAPRDPDSANIRAQQEALFNSMSEGVLVLDAHGLIQMVNRSLQDIFRIERDVRGRTVLEAFRLRELEQLLDRLKTEHTVQGFQLELPDLEERSLEVNAAAVRGAKGQSQGAILVFHDLTRTRQLENTRQEFVANVSHELRTPLSLIKGYVETLLDGAKDDPEQAVRFLHTIDKHTDRLTFLIEDILTISKLESGQIALNQHPVELRGEVARVLEDLRAVAAEQAIRIENSVPEDLIAYADSDRLEQVLFNLIDNALKYGRKGGCVEISARTASPDKVEVWIKDDGPGIPPEAQERVFERFYRVDRARSRESGGTGLGLSIVKHIVQAHGGEVWLQSKLGQGTQFHFTLPTHTSDTGG